MTDNATTSEITIPSVAESSSDAEVATTEATINHTDQESAESNTEQRSEAISTQQENNEGPEESPAPPNSPFVLKPPSGNSKLILRNMEDVLSSVKEEHRQKHKLKKEQKRLAKLAVSKQKEKSVVMDPKSEASSVDETEDKQPLIEKGQKSSKSKAKHKTRKSPLKSSSPVAENASIMKHFIRTPKKDSPSKESASPSDADGIPKSPIDAIKPVDEEESSSEAAKPANAFKLMMNARNRSLGTNSNGQELSISPSVKATESPKPDLVKRKLVLQEWADRKGGDKRKLEEEARAAYVDEKLDLRGKRLKKMLMKPEECTAKKSNGKSEKSSKKDLSLRRNRRRTRRRRLSLASSEDSNGPTPPKVAKESEIVILKEDSETEDFLAKLSSPTKKRDNLFGYFPKTESPKKQAFKALKEQVASEESELTKKEIIKSKRASNAKMKIISPTAAPKDQLRGSTKINTPELTETKINKQDVSLTPSGRPRRSCTGKPRYDYNDEMSPTKSEKAVKAAKQTAKKTAESAGSSVNDSIEIIELDNSNTAPVNDTCETPETSKKLAPLFVRQVPKPSPDPHRLLARAEFLRSGVPEKLKQEQAKQKQFEQHYESTFEYFPCIAHVQQLSADEAPVKMPRRFLKKFKLHDEADILLPLTVSAKKRRNKEKLSEITPGSITLCTSADYQFTYWPNSVAIQPPLPDIKEKVEIIKIWKYDYGKFPTYKCFNQMSRKYRYCSAQDVQQDTQQVGDSFVVTRRSRRSLKQSADNDENVEPPPEASNGELLFTEKYRPKTLEETLVNTRPVRQLRDFLANWTTGSDASCSNSPSVSNRNSQKLDDSFDFANDSNSASTVGNTVVLLGPCSSGKTNAVYTVAESMNFNVLEVNAGMRRTGKKLIQELQEATQSHQIRKDSKPGQSKQLLKKSLKGLKTKQRKLHQASDESSEGASDLGQSVRKSLILIEDADIVFEQLDCGFTDALNTLAASSKRPVVIVANDPYCVHLQRLIQQNVIHFKQPHDLSICRYLSLLAFTEKCPADLDELMALYAYNNMNLRKTLNELQFFIQSGGNRKNECGVTPMSEPALSDKALSPSRRSTHSNDADDEGDRDSHDGEANYRNAEQNVEEENGEPEEQNINEESDDNDEEELLDEGEDDPNIANHFDDYDPGDREPGEVADNALKSLNVQKTLFKLYTCDQNFDYRLSFPVDFEFLRVNLSELFKNARNLENVKQEDLSPSQGSNCSRKTECQNTITSTAEATSTTDARKPLDELCDFYRNISMGALLNDCAIQSSEDRLVPNLSEEIAHTLTERSLVVNLNSQLRSLENFVKPDESPTLCQYLSSYSWSTRSTRALDYEPALRAMCRSEKVRANEERRSSRFYHYLRNYMTNLNSFSMKPFDAVCKVLHVHHLDDYDDDEEEET